MELASGPEEGSLLWTPRPEAFAKSRLADYLGWLERHRGVSAVGYAELWEWSTSSLESFWESIWDYFEVVGDRGRGEVLEQRTMPGARWFTGASLNYAENALIGLPAADPALIAYSEMRPMRQLTGDELRLQVGSVAAGLRQMGVGQGDRVAAYLPNIPEAVVAFLATVSLGAIWSSCSPDFGENAVLDRFQQIQPKVLFAVDGYRYGGRDFDRRELVARLAAGLPSVERVVSVPHLFAEVDDRTPESLCWEQLVAELQTPQFAAVPFDHPLWILYSSGTTGLPKPIVHSHGGIVLEQLKVLGLHADIRPGDRSFWFTTTGWMMWNYLISALLVGGAPVLYDGSPAAPDVGRLWAVAADARVTHFGTSAAHLSACIKAGLQPGKDFDLSSIRFLGSTGSPLSPLAFAWVYRAVKQDLWVVSLSGGTDLCTAFVLGCPGMPVRAGVIQCRALGALIEAFDQAGTAVLDQVAELVIREPMPSMPVFFWGDPEGVRYRASYFSSYPGIWRHGDWIRIRADGGVVIYGRSDATINRHGVRMGTSEIYRVVEEMGAIDDSLVVDIAQPQGDSMLALFVTLAGGETLTAELSAAVKTALRNQLSPRHVPDQIRQVARVPRTLSGKKLEVPIKRILEGAVPDEVLDLDAVADPGSLTPFLELAEVLAAARRPTQGG
ncbi:MAG TPA: acetoacetate--CoA ligase [Candidatus Dormibacteraeota bacterium]|nr:acetoacetate--CoA ligase [Candidatus Dormibacteraeota bacterium]